jgi:predicted AlkP superfamily phosphohydrolase/phosphomutase
VNRVLVEAGYLRLARPAHDEWDAGMIADDTRALALDPGRIYLHRRERFARGRMAEADAPALLADLKALLLGLTFEGRRVMNRVLDGPELYGESAVGDAPDGRPDLVCVPEPGFDLKAKFDRAEVFGLHGRFGMHWAGDAFFYDSNGNAAASGPERVREVGGLVLEHFGLGNAPDGIIT